ncbi:metal dependent phosphohydrolase [Nitzschia inconspicua]|uniref:Metal dependent phosphohydrolase n=1 Tax=Nitzschia inconspicua TaxID=303405 RepID=A0A9K3PPY0_9STRA|nr:metal dependent phosphohydrolase [Nitzschia inconspicua]
MLAALALTFLINGPSTAALEQSLSSESSNVSILSQLIEVHPLWLRERCLEAFYADSETRQPKYNLHEEKEFLSVQSVEAIERDGSHGFRVIFSDDRTCFYESDILQAELRNERTFLQTDDWGFPPENLWDRTLLAPPVFEHDDVVKESDAQRKFLSTLISTGIALVNNVPRTEGECARFGGRFSSVRETEWGLNFNVRTSPDTAGGNQRKDLAYTSHAIGMHVDSAYRVDDPPSFQLLHAIEHCSGADCYVHNYFVDGLRVAADLCRSNRTFFDILASTTLRWENNGGDDSSILYRYSPIIELLDSSTSVSGECPQVSSISFSAKSGGYAPNLPKDQLEVFYQAKREFSGMLHSNDYIIRLQLYPGALVIFDNRRVLHSRSSIAETDGERWLQGCYLNRDGVAYQYERMRRKFSSTLTETPFRNLREATKADYDRMGREYDRDVAQKTLDNMIGILKSQRDAFLGAPVSLLEHGLQTATRALRAGEDDETVVISLFHDMFETLAVKNHGELVASMLAPWISPRSQWVLAHHEIFQGYYYFGYYGMDANRRDMFRNHVFYNWTVAWCEKYDQASFDPDYPSLDVTYFLPIVERVLSRTQYWWNLDHPKAGAVSVNESDKNNNMEPTDTGNTTMDEKDATLGRSQAECRETWTCYSLPDDGISP